MHFDQGLYDQALEDFRQALVISRDVGNREGEGRTLNNIGLVYHRQGLYDQALENYRQVLLIARELGLRAMEEAVLSNIANLPDY